MELIKKPPKIAIVGAGAMGVVTGYHLALAGAGVVYLVRPGRASEIPSEYRLYSYDDADTHIFGGFEVITDVVEIAAHRPEFVLMTVDGASLASNEGRTLLANIGDAVRGIDATLIIGSVGIGLREMAVSITALADNRVINGMIAMLGHKTMGVDLPVHSPTDPVTLSQADFAFRHLSEAGFMLESRNAQAASRFAEIFDKSGIARCIVVPPDLFGVQSRAIMPLFVTSEILNWPSASILINDALWPVTVEAVRAIQGLREHGEAGRAAAEQLSRESLAEVWISRETAALPLDWQGFNAYQHGKKVRQADLQLLNACIERGTSEGRDMKAVSDLLGILENHSR